MQSETSLSGVLAVIAFLLMLVGTAVSFEQPVLFLPTIAVSTAIALFAILTRRR